MSKGVYFCGGEDAPAGPYRGRVSGWWAKDILAKVLACQREPEHSYGPSGYTDWHLWAERSYQAGWRPKLCDCGLFLLMQRKASRGATSDAVGRSRPGLAPVGPTTGLGAEETPPASAAGPGAATSHLHITPP